MAFEKFFVRPAPSITWLRVAAGLTVVGAGVATGTVTLVVVGIGLVAWALMGTASRRAPTCRLQVRTGSSHNGEHRDSGERGERRGLDHLG